MSLLRCVAAPLCRWGRFHSLPSVASLPSALRCASGTMITVPVDTACLNPTSSLRQLVLVQASSLTQLAKIKLYFGQSSNTAKDYIMSGAVGMVRASRGEGKKMEPSPLTQLASIQLYSGRSSYKYFFLFAYSGGEEKPRASVRMEVYSATWRAYLSQLRGVSTP